MRVVASAAMVAATVAMLAAMMAMTKERIAASCTAELFQAATNHLSETPSHTASEGPALKANTTSVAMGR